MTDDVPQLGYSIQTKDLNLSGTETFRPSRTSASTSGKG